MSEVLDERGADAPPRRAPRARWAGLRPLVLRLHFYVGVFVGPFVLVAATTGLLYTVTPQLERAVHHDALTVAGVGAARVDLRTQLAVAAAAVPGGTVAEIRPADAPDATTRVAFTVPDLPDGWFRTAFVDPYSGGTRAVLDTYGEWLPVRAWFDELHRTLLLGDVGRVYSELAASWLGVLAVSGLALWVARRRRHRRVRRTLLPETPGNGVRGRARLRSWHGSVGLWAAVGMLFLSATGLTWSQFAGANVTALRSALDWSTPSVSTSAPSPATPPGDAVDRVLGASRAAGLSGPVAITPGGADGPAWTVQQTTRSWPEHQDAVAVDPGTGAVVDQLRFADWPLAAKLARWGVDAHMGLLFGVANQVALAALALGILCLVLWGYRMWWLRRPTRRAGGPAVVPGGSERPGFGAVAVVGALAVALGLVVPLLGLSLLAFLLGDAVWQRVGRPPR